MGTVDVKRGAVMISSHRLHKSYQSVWIFRLSWLLVIGLILVGCSPAPEEPPNPAVSLALPTVFSSPTMTLTLSPTLTPLLIPTTPVAESQYQAGDERSNPKDGAQLMYIPAGKFIKGLQPDQVDLLLRMCSECRSENFTDAQPAQEEFTVAFWIYQMEVTNAQYQLCVLAGDCRPPARLNSKTRQDYYGNPLYDDYPVVNVDWFAARDYCRWTGGRLPLELEWEKAARGIDGRLFPWGNQPPTAELANVAPFYDDTTVVGAFPLGISPYGVLHMAGNVWEWVQDWYTEGEKRSGRGGSWGWESGFASSGFRDWWEPEKFGTGVGFRCAMDAER